MNNEKLLDLLMASIIYIDSKNSAGNPFVKSFGKRDEQEAFEYLVACTEDAKEFLPLVDELNQIRLSDIEKLEEQGETESEEV